MILTAFEPQKPKGRVLEQFHDVNVQIWLWAEYLTSRGRKEVVVWQSGGLAVKLVI